MWPPKKNKYGAIKTDGYDSKLEANYANALKSEGKAFVAHKTLKLTLPPIELDEAAADALPFLDSEPTARDVAARIRAALNQVKLWAKYKIDFVEEGGMHTEVKGYETRDWKQKWDFFEIRYPHIKKQIIKKVRFGR